MSRIERLIGEKEKRTIDSIPLLKNSMEDRRIWPHEKNDTLIVRSAYGFIRDRERADMCSKALSSFITNESA